ncbi:C40 family peptidase [Maribacter algicola]|uniref:C40 family peptidase n=1 Tax=Meishania litoralis TaxID=3434685 RepID=A0ACC7LJS8_9FLAO
MRKIVYIFLGLLVVNCGTYKKKTSYSKNKSFGETRKVTVEASESKTVEIDESDHEDNSSPNGPVADKIINTALTYSGTRYKYGGTTKKGMDCSGLLYVSFGEHDIALPRISYQMAEEGRRIRINKVKKGDLLFFKTSKRKRRINHVGMVVAVEGDDIKFIHASTSRGVIVSSLREGYWNYAFVKATRVL